MGRGRLLTGEFKKESYPIAKTPVCAPSRVRTGNLPVWGCTLVKRAPATAGRGFCTIFVQAHIHRYIPAPSCTAGARQAFALNPKHLPCSLCATHTLPFEPVAGTATCTFCLIHMSPGIQAFSFTLPLSLPFSHTHTHWLTGGLISQRHTCSLRLSRCLRVSCSQLSLKHTVCHQCSHMHHPNRPGTQQQAAHQMLFRCRRHLTTPPSLASYTHGPDFGLTGVDVGQEAQGHKEDRGSSTAFLKEHSSSAPAVTETGQLQHKMKGGAACPGALGWQGITHTSYGRRRREGRFPHRRGVCQSDASSKARAVRGA